MTDNSNIFLAKLDRAGQLVWAQRFGGAGEDRGRAVAVDNEGNVIITGHFSQTIDLGSGPLTSRAENDILLAKFDGSGTVLWARQFGRDQFQTAADVACGDDGSIHGLVESLHMRWQRGEFTDGRYSDLIVRNLSSGANAIWAMNGTTPSGVTYALPTVSPGGCNWYIGATGDFNFDGSQDIVWHGPGCNAESIWFMNGTSYSFSGGSMPAVGPAWRMIGSGDFNHDLRPDIVWANDATSQLSIWYMNGGSFITDHVVQLPAGFTGAAVLRGAYLDYYDSVLARNPTTGENRLYNWGGSAYPVAQDPPFYIAMPAVGGTAWWPIGGGHYGDPTNFGLYNLDVLWASTNLTSIWTYTGGSSTGETFETNHVVSTPSPLVIAGPR
ncbi:MAG TPA: VCBS repeat-containing protein [Kofleriaceae bacterium]|nr:VCBS repeat-containing protein [Kofleriaceae bacterium]